MARTISRQSVGALRTIMLLNLHITPCANANIADRSPSARVLDAHAGNMEDVSQRAQRASKSNLVHGITELNQAYRSNLVPLITEPSRRTESLSTHSSRVEMTKVNPQAVPTRTQLLPNCDGEVDRETSAKSVVPSKRRQLSINKTVGQASISNDLSDYMRLEAERCHRLGICFSQNDFDMAMMTATPSLERRYFVHPIEDVSLCGRECGVTRILERYG
jgi:hypothetical protein